MNRLAISFLLCFAIVCGIGKTIAQSATFEAENGLLVHWGESVMITVPTPPVDYIRYTLQITGPDGEVLEKQPVRGVEFEWSVQDVQMDGRYKFQFMPSFHLNREVASQLVAMRNAGDEAGINRIRKANNLIDEATVYYATFQVRDGQPVNPLQLEDMLDAALYKPAMNNRSSLLTASVDNQIFESVSGEKTPDFGSNANFEKIHQIASQIFTTDVIAQLSLCVGQDCISGESFGFTTVRLKENNLRIEFTDTSNSSSFPTTDWMLEANSNLNGGESYFRIIDQSAGKNILTVMANAPTNSLVISESGNLGLGTPTPGQFEINVEDGDTPTMRLSQNSSVGWSPQIWDVAGNETNFFVRDATNGALLPFKILPGSRTNSLKISANAVGMNNDLHLAGNVVPIADESLQHDVTPLQNALPLIGQLNPVSWSFSETDHTAEIELPEGRQYGLTAQQVEQVMPDLVHSHVLGSNESGSENQLKGVNYDALVPFLIKAIQEQQELIEIQDQRIKALEAVLTTFAEASEGSGK